MNVAVVVALVGCALMVGVLGLGVLAHTSRAGAVPPRRRERSSDLHPWGSVDDGSGYPIDKCGPGCDMQLVRPGKTQCDHGNPACPSRVGAVAADLWNASNDMDDRHQWVVRRAYDLIWDLDARLHHDEE